MSKYAEKKLKNIVDWLATTLVATTDPHPDCAHCDNGRKWASTHPIGDSQWSMAVASIRSHDDHWTITQASP